MISEKHFSKHLTRELVFLGYTPNDDLVDLMVDIIVHFIEKADEFSQDELIDYLHISLMENGYGTFNIMLEDVADIVMKYLEDNEIMDIDWEVEVELE